MTKINDPKLPPAPVRVDFWWEPEGGAISYTLDGKTYPYHHEQDEVVRPSDIRYRGWSTFIKEPVIFDATDLANKGNPHVVTPPGVGIAEYRWDLGDSTIAFGPLVTHTYLVADPDIFVTLIVTDSRGINWSCLKPLNLVNLATKGIVAGYKIRS